MSNSIIKNIDLELRKVLYGKDGEFIDPFVIKLSAVQDLDFVDSFDELKDFINNAKIILTDTQIKKYLSDLMNKEYPGLKDRLENDKYLDDDNAYINKVKDKNIDALYYFEPYSLYYFTHYVEILKEKCLSFLNLINKLDMLDDDDIYYNLQKQLISLDIRLNKTRNIYYMDAVRIEEAFVYNLIDLYNKITIGNNLETYFKFKLSKAKLMKECLFESNLYPRKEIQIMDLKYLYDKQFIELSDNQQNIIVENMKKNWFSIDNNNEIDNNHNLIRTR